MKVQDALDAMNRNRGIAKKKGDFGEKAALAVVRSYQERRGGFIVHSFSYPYASNSQSVNYPGNIKLEDGKFVSIDGNKSTHDEIDILYVTPNKIFAIEAKARTGKWEIYDYWSKQKSTKVDKYPVAQSEKHARHLYHHLWQQLPDGIADYIIPLTVFIDKATIVDTRNDIHKESLPVAILNNLEEVIMKYDTPLDYQLNVKEIRKKLKQLGKGTYY